MAAAGAKELQRFCVIDGWTELRGARGVGRDHLFFVKELPDGRTLRTKVSHGTHGKDSYSRGLWKHIWSEQLGLAAESEFWAVLKLHRPAQRQGEAELQPAGPAVPGWLVQRLIHTAGLREDEVAKLSAEEAEERWLEFQTRPQLSDLASAPASAQALDDRAYGLAVG